MDISSFHCRFQSHQAAKHKELGKLKNKITSQLNEPSSVYNAAEYKINKYRHNLHRKLCLNNMAAYLGLRHLLPASYTKLLEKFIRNL